MISIPRWLLLAASLLALGLPAGAARKRKPPEPSPLERYIRDAGSRPAPDASESASGSTWTPAARLVDLGSDLRASQVDDVITILVAEQASAVSAGTTKTARKSSASSNVTALAGVTRATGPWANLAGANTNTQLDGQGSTTRQTNLSTTLSARVSQVLPNGFLVVEGTKEIGINSERQVITVRGVVRPVDLSPGNTVRSDHLTELEVRINGKGVVGDSIRRPFILYRVLMGLLPF